MNLQDLIINEKEVVDLEDVLLSRENKQRVLQLIKELKYVEELHKYGLNVNNKILLHGNSGCGKTITAKAIANALKKNLITLNLSNVVSARIGETSQNIRMVFEKAGKEKAILFLDEFDQIGKARGNDEKDVGEMRRLVNSIIQLIDYYPKNALLISATNHVEVIDTALLRRFQLRMDFEMPSGDTLDKYYDKILSAFPNHLQSITRKYDVSFAEVKDYAHTVVKSMLIEEWEKQEIVR